MTENKNWLKNKENEDGAHKRRKLFLTPDAVVFSLSSSPPSLLLYSRLLHFSITKIHQSVFSPVLIVIQARTFPN